MEEKKEKKVLKIGLSTVIIIIAFMIIAVMSYYIYKVAEAKKISDQKVDELEEQVEKLENTINSISTTISQTKEDEENKKEQKKEDKKAENELISNVDYIEIMVEDIESLEGLTYKEPKKITNEKILEEFLAKVNNSKLYEKLEEDFGASGFTELPPMAYIYDKQGNKTVITVSNLDADANLMMIWTKEDESDKTTYKVDSSLKKYMEQLYK